MYTELQAIKPIPDSNEKKQMEEAIIAYITELSESERQEALKEELLIKKAFLNWNKLDIPEEVRTIYEGILLQRRQQESKKKMEIINHFFDKYESYYIELGPAIVINKYRIEDGRIRVSQTIAINKEKYPEVADYIRSTYEHISSLKETLNSPI